jgi:hypothetical protein
VALEVADSNQLCVCGPEIKSGQRTRLITFKTLCIGLNVGQYRRIFPVSRNYSHPREKISSRVQDSGSSLTSAFRLCRPPPLSIEDTPRGSQPSKYSKHSPISLMGETRRFVSLMNTQRFCGQNARGVQLACPGFRHRVGLELESLSRQESVLHGEISPNIEQCVLTRQFWLREPSVCKQGLSCKVFVGTDQRVRVAEARTRFRNLEHQRTSELQNSAMSMHLAQAGIRDSQPPAEPCPL